MRSTKCTRLFVRDDQETEVEVTFDFTAGTPESGRHGPIEHYDPGSGPEIESISAVLLSDRSVAVELSEDEIDRFRDETIEDPEFDPFPARDDY